MESVLFHTAVIAELFEGLDSQKEFRAADALLASGAQAAPSGHDLSHSLKLMRRLRPSHGMDWHDSLIAATGLRLSVGVATINSKHFRAFRGLKVVVPY
jgi:predicted nucleic acid-binding protein